MLQVSASPSFNRVAKKLHARDKKTLDEAIDALRLQGLSTLGDDLRIAPSVTKKCLCHFLKPLNAMSRNVDRKNRWIHPGIVDTSFE